MVSMVGSVTILIAMSSTGGIFFNRNPNNLVLPPLPGYGAGFPNGNPDGYGWVDHGVHLPLTADRTPGILLPALPGRARPRRSFLPNYYNPYISRGQRFLPFAGCGGPHPASGPPAASAMRVGPPVQRDARTTSPGSRLPSSAAGSRPPPVNPGTTGLRP